MAKTRKTIETVERERERESYTLANKSELYFVSQLHPIKKRYSFMQRLA